MKRDIYTEITNQLVAQLEADPGAWQRSWGLLGTNGVALRDNGSPYKGVNAFILALSGRSNRFWLTYNRATALGGQVRGGEKATTVVFFKPLIIDKGDDDERTVRLLRHYAVFNAEQIDGLPPRFDPVSVERPVEERIATAEAYIKATGSVIKHGGSVACYVPSADYIRLPEFGAFADAVAYYGTSLHEHIHWTGPAKRCDRKFGASFGDDDYAREELVAEIGAAFLCGKLGLSPEPRLDHAQYLGEWLRVLKADNKAIFRAAAAAQVAVDHLDSLQPGAVVEVQEAA